MHKPCQSIRAMLRGPSPSKRGERDSTKRQERQGSVIAVDGPWATRKPHLREVARQNGETARIAAKDILAIDILSCLDC